MDVFLSPYWGLHIWQVIIAGMIHEIKERDGQKKGRWIHTSNKLRLDSDQHVTSLRTVVANCGFMNVFLLGEEPGVTVWQLKPKRVASMICSGVV